MLERWREDRHLRAPARPAPRGRARRSGASTTGRRRRTASRAPTTCSRARSRTSTRATGDARPLRPPQGRLGLPRAPGRARDREGARDRLEGRDRGVRDRRVQPALPRVGAALRRGLEPADRADRLLDRPRRPLRDDDQRLHRVGLVVAAPDLGPGAPLQRAQGGPVLPARRHRALLARGRAGLRGRRRPRRSTCGSRSPRSRRPTRSRVAGRARRQPARLDDDAVDADLPRRGRRRGGDRVRASAARRRGLCRRPATGRAGPRRGRRGARPLPGRGARRESATSRRSTTSRARTSGPLRPLGAARRLRHHRRRHRARPHRARLRRGRLPARRAVRDDAAEPGPARRHLRRAGPRLPGQDGLRAQPARSSRRCARAAGCFALEEYEHSYPHCWRCGTPLLYYAKSSWYIRTTEVRDRMLAENETIGWRPDHVKHGRFGKWLEGNVDWALSRERYWGTPLPIWECESADCEERVLRRLGRRAARARRRGSRRPAPPLHRRRHASLRDVRRARCAGSRR